MQVVQRGALAMKGFCARCGYNKFNTEPIFELYNKEEEYVEGYGHKPVWVQTGERKICIACGFFWSCFIKSVGIFTDILKFEKAPGFNLAKINLIISG